jgi:hypothetical protein
LIGFFKNVTETLSSFLDWKSNVASVAAWYCRFSFNYTGLRVGQAKITTCRGELLLERLYFWKG